MADAKTFEIVCPNCNKNRIVSRTMIYHLRKGKVSGKCKSCSSKGNKSHFGSHCSKITKEKMSLASKGKKKSLQHRLNMSKARSGIRNEKISGINHYLWIFDRSLIKKQDERNNPEYKQWRYRVFKRDRHICRINNQNCNGKVVAHHILSWIKYPELRYEIKNGITLCQFHHPKKRVDEQMLMPIFQQMNLAEVKTN